MLLYFVRGDHAVIQGRTPLSSIMILSVTLIDISTLSVGTLCVFQGYCVSIYSLIDRLHGKKAKKPKRKQSINQ